MPGRGGGCLRQGAALPPSTFWAPRARQRGPSCLPWLRCPYPCCRGPWGRTASAARPVSRVRLWPVDVALAPVGCEGSGGCHPSDMSPWRAWVGPVPWVASLLGVEGLALEEPSGALCRLPRTRATTGGPAQMAPRSGLWPEGPGSRWAARAWAGTQGQAGGLGCCPPGHSHCRASLGDIGVLCRLDVCCTLARPLTRRT